METTPTGKWLVEVFMNKEVQDTDYDLAEMIDVLADVDAHGDLKDMVGSEAKLDVAKTLGLVE